MKELAVSREEHAVMSEKASIEQWYKQVRQWHSYTYHFKLPTPLGCPRR